VGIEPVMACGDGYVDTEAGEECDPKDPDREYESACASIGFPLGKAGCDPDDCTIIKNDEQCAACGDGKIDRPGEDCDGSVPLDVLCVNGADEVTCTDDCQLDFGACPSCGNGKVDPPLEECDPYEAAGDVTQPIYCSEIPSKLTKPFSYGVVLACLGDCTYDRSACSFCGDGEVDGPTTPRSTPHDDGAPLMLAEKCDGNAADPGELTAYCRKRCTGHDVGGIVLDCNYDCAENCLSFEDVPDEELYCCVPPGESCPGQGGQFRCCWELDPANEGSDLDPCTLQSTGGDVWAWVCR
jgi:hypothetical protein